MEFKCSPCENTGSLRVLWLSSTFLPQKHAQQVVWWLQIKPRCESVYEWLSVSTCFPLDRLVTSQVLDAVIGEVGARLQQETGSEKIQTLTLTLVC